MLPAHTVKTETAASKLGNQEVPAEDDAIVIPDSASVHQEEDVVEEDAFIVPGSDGNRYHIPRGSPSSSLRDVSPSDMDSHPGHPQLPPPHAAPSSPAHRYYLMQRHFFQSRLRIQRLRDRLREIDLERLAAMQQVHAKLGDAEKDLDRLMENMLDSVFFN